MLKSKKTILGVILCAVMTLCLAIGVFTGTSTSKTAYALGAEEHNHTGWMGVSALPTEAGDHNIYLTDNITLPSTWNVPTGTTNLCLNGYVIKANCTEDNKFSVITVGAGATLNLYDCGTTPHYFTVDDTGLWTLTNTTTIYVINGGVITGGNVNTNGGGGVYVAGTLNIFGGNIVGNTTSVNGGGGVYVAGTLNISGGNIVGNTISKGSGAGVYSSGDINMSGGNIAYNTTKSNGGGVSFNKSGKTFTMTGGSINNNTASNCGGVQVVLGTFIMTGGSINNNTATNYGGVFVNDTIILGGTAQIVGNTLNNGTTNNVYLPNNKTITLDNPTTMNIGITTQTPPTSEAPVKITADGTADYSANFFSDSESYGVCYNAETAGEEYLELKNKVVFDEQYLWNGGTAITYGDTYSEEIPKIYFDDDEVTDVTLTYDYYKKNTDNTWTKLAFTTKPTDAGSYKVKFEVPNSNETYCGSKEYEFDIAQKEVELDWTAPTNLVFDNTAKIPTVVATNIDDDCVVTASLTTDGDNINAGRFTFTATGLSNPNYKLPESVEDVTSPEYEITKATISSIGFTDITAPIAGETIPTTVSGIDTGAKYIGEIEWIPSGSSSSFAYDTEYTAIITLTITDENIGNYQFADNVTLQGITGWTKSTSESNDTKLVYTNTFAKTAHHHSLSQVDGKTATCTDDGFKVAYHCVGENGCDLYFTDSNCENEIGDLTAYNAWKLNEGKILAHHIKNKVAGVDPTPKRSGYKDAWKCSECNKYFEDENCTTLIGDEEAYNTWKTTDGYLAQLPTNGLSTGAIIGIVGGSAVSLGAIGYLIWFIIKKKKEDNKY